MDDWRTLLGWSLPVGRPLGIPVRVGWTVGVVFLYGVYQWARWPGLGVELALLLSLLTTLALYLVIWTHEVGHALAGARLGSPVHGITLTALGGLAHASQPAASPRAEALIALAGPVVHLLWLPLAWGLTQVPLDLRLGPVTVAALGHHFLVLNVALLLFNLLPCFPMDGGRVLRALLARRLHPNLATIWACRVGILGGIALAAWGLSRSGLGGTILFVIGFSNALHCMQEMTAARFSDGPYAPPADPWALDADAWRRGPPPAREERLWPRLMRGGGRRATPVLEEPPARAPPLPPAPREAAPSGRRSLEEEAELDALLERVSTVGVPGLTEAERLRLQTLSRSGGR